MVVSVATGTPAALVRVDTEGVNHGGNTCEGCVIFLNGFFIYKGFSVGKKKSLVMNVGGFSANKKFSK
jgi:hypothetical protein